MRKNAGGQFRMTSVTSRMDHMGNREDPLPNSPLRRCVFRSMAHIRLRAPKSARLNRATQLLKLNDSLRDMRRVEGLWTLWT